ncbi:unnamed protein product [Cercopithifilaria johnstoni]|uniref:Fibronectin type-III domain-containing protein n=1 Tax=Cercopithifilaria johnstoni TaxID=2874296 RepID=A0A8J2Q8P1_9BILA|nr:unnamed protein product [Cercopithifilaria johnstoni]
MTNDILPVKTEYLNTRRIRIQMNDNNINAFVYIFEYSTVTTEPDKWIFAGASSLPDVNFTIDDACRDYQFRVIVILKNEKHDRWLIVYRPRIIPVDLPTFAITPDKIQTELPIYNANDDAVVVYISWENPIGYTDADIYGYESPAVYPVQCNSPEGELSAPSIELKKGGARLRISLPSEVLDSKCRVWAEVQMLPRCIRLEPFSVQQSFELDCDKLTTLEICTRREIAPQCTDVIDVWGYGNNATIMWSPQHGFGAPLYYHIRYGPSKMKGTPPLATWTIASLHELKITGNNTKLQLQVNPDTNYGIQICGVYNEHRKEPKFELIRVIPFICTSCAKTPIMQSCGECTKIEDSLLFRRRCHPKGGIGCTSADTIFNSSDIKDEGLLNPLTVLPSDVFIDSPPSDNAKINPISEQHIPLVRKNFNTSIQQPSIESTSKLETFLADDNVELTLSEPQMTEQQTKQSSSNLDRTKQTTTSNNIMLHKVEITPTMSSLSKIELSTFAEHSQITTATNKEKLQSERNSCTLSNGIICEFDCIDQRKCNCPNGTYILMDNGSCLLQSDHRPLFVCFSTTDVKATWNPWMHALQIQSKKIYNEIKMHTNYDRIFLEFGHIKYIRKEQISLNGIIFDEQNGMSNKIVIRTNKILQNGLFLTIPYSFYINQTIDPLTYQYGLRICAFNNSEIKNPFAANWTQNTEHSIFHLSAVQFERGYVGNIEHIASNEQKQITRMAFVIVPIILIVLLIFLLVFIIYANCARLKHCYDRRKTRHFRPFVWNGNIPPMTNGTVHEKHSSVITKSTF